jgi:hypothetical protein
MCCEKSVWVEEKGMCCLVGDRDDSGTGRCDASKCHAYKSNTGTNAKGLTMHHRHDPRVGELLHRQKKIRRKKVFKQARTLGEICRRRAKSINK